MSDVLYDSPLELVHEAVGKSSECVAQSVVPLAPGRYVCACSCGNWEVIAASREEGLALARAHTGSPR